MSGPFDPRSVTRVQRTYTLTEATDLMKMYDGELIGSGSFIRWVSARTGQPVSIGYTS